MTTKSKNMVVAVDLGYGEIKANIDGKYIDQQSVVSEVKQVANDPIDHTNEEIVQSTVENILDNLDVTIHEKRFLVGSLASSSSLTRRGFDINSQLGKANTDLSTTLPLALIAGRAVQEAYEKDEDIFEPLSVKVVMTTALPISEIGFGESKKREEYASLFLGSKHIVILNNFDTPISVTIQFSNVRIYKEGEVATALAIKNGPKELKNSLKKSIKSDYPELADNADHIIDSAENVLGIDIGQGTTDLALTTDGKADAYNSNSIAQGYGTVLRKASKYLARMSGGFNVKDIIEFTRIVNSNPSNKMDEEKKKMCLKAIDTSTSSLVLEIEENLNDILEENNNLEVIYIFGGGSIPLKNQTSLTNSIKDSLQRHRCSAALVWVDAKYAQRLNEIGLEILAKALDEVSK